MLPQVASSGSISLHRIGGRRRIRPLRSAEPRCVGSPHSLPAGPFGLTAYSSLRSALARFESRAVSHCVKLVDAEGFEPSISAM